jgi:hypothetical protein
MKNRKRYHFPDQLEEIAREDKERRARKDKERRARKDKERRFRGDRKKQTSNLLSTMRMIRQIKELSETLSEEEKNKLAKELESTIESIKRKLDKLK